MEREPSRLDDIYSDDLTVHTEGLSGEAIVFKNKEIKELIGPLFEILKKMTDKIDSGKYGYIVGDDASGRIPALIISGFIKEISKDKDFAKPETYFLAGSGQGSKLYHREKRPKLSHSIEMFFKSHAVKPVLIVTDTVATGNSLLPLVETLKNNIGADVDIATVSLLENIYSSENNLETDIYHSGDDEAYQGIYKAAELSGVKKNAGDVLSKSLRARSLELKDQEGADTITLSVRDAREDVKKASVVLAEMYKTWESKRTR